MNRAMKRHDDQQPILPTSTILWLVAGVLALPSGPSANAQFVIGEATNLGAPVNTADIWEYAPQVSADGLTLYYQSGCRCNDADPDIYMATRETIDAPWTDPHPIAGFVNTEADELSPSLSLDGQQLYFSDGFRPGFSTIVRADGEGGGDIWVSSWNESTQSWGEPQNIATINSHYSDYAPDISSDGLELYFSSTRPGGPGNTDIWVARREAVTDPWGEPKNLFAINSSGQDDFPSVSTDGLSLFFGSNRSDSIATESGLWVSTRARIEDDWGPPAHLGRINTDLNGNEFNSKWIFEADLSPDGKMLYYSRWDSPDTGGGELWQVPVLPLQGVIITGMGGEHWQDFDGLLLDATHNQMLPTGWAITTNGVVFENTISQDFPFPAEAYFPRKLMSIFNAGGDLDTDRSLAVGVSPSNDATIIQLLAQVADSDALSFQLQFDIEVWDAEASTRTREKPGEAAFTVSIDIDFGDGFVSLQDLGTVTTGAILSPPTTSALDGNAEANSVAFDSGVISAWIPQGSQLRVRWEPSVGNSTRGWVLGLDNVWLRLNEAGNPKSGDFNGDGALDDMDLDALIIEILAASPDTQFDLDGNGRVEGDDLSYWYDLSAPKGCMK